jgi:Sugar (and other) transporter
LFVVFGVLSDRFGRKELFLGGCLLAAFTYIPVFHGLTHFGNPALEAAQEHMPVVLVADPESCSLQFNLLGSVQALSPCDLSKNILATAGVSYRQVAAGVGAMPEVYVGNLWVSYQGIGQSTQQNQALTRAAYQSAVLHALYQAGYPASANPDTINKPAMVLLLTLLICYVAMVYGPMAAILTELFPTRIRYTAMSLPYHLGNGWFGGFLPATAFAMVAASGNMYMGLWYPIAVATLTLAVGLLFLPETRHLALDASD